MEPFFLNGEGSYTDFAVQHLKFLPEEYKETSEEFALHFLAKCRQKPNIQSKLKSPSANLVR